MNKRELLHSPANQSIRERRLHTVELTAGLSATSPAVKVFDELTETDISAQDDVMVGTASVDGNVFTTPVIQLPTAGRTYRVECWFLSGAEQWIRYFRLIADV